MEKIKRTAELLVAETSKVIFGKEHQIRLVVMALLSGGHVLLEDLPGVGKTTLVKTLSRASGCESRRIQFVPDLLPSDITGMNIYDRNTGGFKHLPGPVFTNILLGDEINRAVPRTQAALLQAMEEKQVTIDGETRDLPNPFIVLATQNPVEEESTFPLPTAQMDRFLIRLSMGYPVFEEEKRMLFALQSSDYYAKVNAVTTQEEIVEMQKEISDIYVSEVVADYLLRLIQATREQTSLRMGASPRASRALFGAAKTWAAMKGREYVTPDDVKELAMPVLAHRLLLSGQARMTGETAEEIMNRILETVSIPPEDADVMRL